MSALALKLIATLTMTIDHLGHFVPGGTYMRIIGRLAFPIYAFLLANGFAHTSNRGRYAYRLALFALISQLPFTLMLKSSIIDGSTSLQPLLWEYVHHGSVITSLLISFLCLWLLEGCKEKLWSRILSWLVVLGVVALYLSGAIRSDYGPKCVLMVLCFYYFRQTPGLMVLMASASLCAILFQDQFLCVLQGSRGEFPMPDSWTLKQLFSLLSMIPILLYNGKKGWSPSTQPWKKLWQLGFYAYYPLHMTVLFFLFRF